MALIINPPSMKRPVQCEEQQESHSNFTKYCACHEMPPSMKRPVQCEEQQESHSNFTKYCAATKWLSLFIPQAWSGQCNARSNRSHPPTINIALASKNDAPKYQRIFPKTAETSFAGGADPTMIRACTDQDPSMNPSVRNPPHKWVYFSRSPRASCFQKYNMHFALRLPFQISSNTAPATKISDSWTSPNFAPARKTECATCVQLHQMLRLRRKVVVEFHQIQHLPRKLNAQLECNFIKYCACHEKCTIL